MKLVFELLFVTCVIHVRKLLISLPGNCSYPQTMSAWNIQALLEYSKFYFNGVVFKLLDLRSMSTHELRIWDGVDPDFSSKSSSKNHWDSLYLNMWLLSNKSIPQDSLSQLNWLDCKLDGPLSRSYAQSTHLSDNWKLHLIVAAPTQQMCQLVYRAIKLRQPRLNAGMKSALHQECQYFNIWILNTFFGHRKSFADFKYWLSVGASGQ